ncbi:hypothetical protein P8C59_006230 [Phyllachora maydis]|uniref:Uncharacterized protein n=1 Tax=Phyllachora maydis TaxID=1825666 RepID=A0AAD9I7A0_9PEZI|nr:hypothetical protein P8C59_006230 [Phyllachora maydis]
MATSTDSAAAFQSLLPPAQLSSKAFDHNFLFRAQCLAMDYELDGPFGSDKVFTMQALRMQPGALDDAVATWRHKLIEECNPETFVAIFGLPRNMIHEKPGEESMHSSFRDYDDMRHQYRRLSFNPAIICAEKRANVKPNTQARHPGFTLPDRSPLRQAWSPDSMEIPAAHENCLPGSTADEFDARYTKPHTRAFFTAVKHSL